MRLNSLARSVGQHPDLRELISGLGESELWSSLCSEARPLFVAASYLANPEPLLVVTNSYDRALQWQAKLGLLGVPLADIRLLPSGLSVLFEDAAPETIALSDRIGALRFLASHKPGIVIATPQAALERTLPLDVLQESFLEIKKGTRADIVAISDQLSKLGYEPSEPVRVPGQTSRRGGILDIFPMGAERPIRIEFFDDEVESLRTFDPTHQRSISAIDHLVIAPSRETLIPTKESGVLELIRQTVEVEASQLSEQAGNKLEENLMGDIQAMEQRVFFDRLDLYRPFIQPDSECAIDLLSSFGRLILDEPLELEATATRQEEELTQALDARHARGEILQATCSDFSLPPEHFSSAQRTVILSSMNAVPKWLHPLVEKEFHAESLEGVRTQSTALTQAITNWLDHGVHVVLGTDQPNRAKTVLNQVEIFPQPRDEASEDFPKGVWQVEGNPGGGFVMSKAKFALLSDHELFGVARLKMPQRKFSDGVPIATVLDLKAGDYVVHINFGIGIYRGLVKRTTEGVEKEFLLVEYKAPDRLFVPADQLDRIQKYMAPGDVPPKINRLTGGDWQKTVGKAREEAREFARDLIKLYAERKAVQRTSFGSDSPWQSEMEGTFPYVETPSQMQAILDVKEDLRQDFPMDRLICGDVGFGKTEVAIRAAFKVAQYGKQVAILCPTTILSEQHYRNIAERLSAFPTRIGLLNRFVHGKERRLMLEDLAKGELDIVIGTHALLSEEVKFKDLGLVIVDEEQKFGVKHKETLKTLRVNVDVLSMSATPIPRTLSMAMMNIRQMSLINDPPPGRLPVRTFVRPYSNEVAREAILRELARGGQVYYVFNRVEGIYHVAERLRKMIPSARIAVGHGQMHEKELEPVMVGFIRGEIDILVSTTIVESGLDIANANTLIVDNADFFGLSQLYQLRGRVGRSDRQAYAYMLYQGAKSLTENASARLAALAEFSQLGAGYSLAFRDLQIRGAGDLLGAKQSGQMNAVGYDLYAQLIESEVQFLKTYADGGSQKTLDDPLIGLEPLPTFDLPVKALLPDDYIGDQGQRLYYYKAMMSSRTLEELRETEREIEDRYGHMPPDARRAVRVMSARMKSRELGIEKVDGKEGRLAVSFKPSTKIHPRAFTLMQKRKREVYMSQDRLIWPYTGDPVIAAEDMVDLMSECQAMVEEQRAGLVN
ncbi:MAG: transcription-repair coupling factor [Fimbriimonadaceae bacterium]|jgi:transcription-repair coupling factor (superfamily II helicase)|nr:transcription-repair coupling factor [Fimbriimonadaceae bacterium]